MNISAQPGRGGVKERREAAVGMEVEEEGLPAMRGKIVMEANEPNIHAHMFCLLHFGFK